MKHLRNRKTQVWNRPGTLQPQKQGGSHCGYPHLVVSEALFPSTQLKPSFPFDSSSRCWIQVKWGHMTAMYSDRLKNIQT